MKKKKYSKHSLTSDYTRTPRTKRTTLYLFGGFITLLMIGSILAYYAQQGESDETTYHNHLFLPYGTGWSTTLNGQQLVFTYHPKALEHYATPPLQLSPKVYLAFNASTTTPNDPTLQRLRAYLIFSGRTAPLACISAHDCGDYPIASCTGTDSVLYYTPGTTTRITQDNNCYTIEAAPGDSTAATELAAYHILGII